MLVSKTKSRVRLRASLACAGVGFAFFSVGCASPETAPAPASRSAAAPVAHAKTINEAPSANVSKIQAWKDAELIASMAPGRTEVVGAGESMKPVYGDNTILVISKIAYEELKSGMSVAYTNRRGNQVVHQLLTRDSTGWRIQGLNNVVEDADRVTKLNLIGVIYASISYDAAGR